MTIPPKLIPLPSSYWSEMDHRMFFRSKQRAWFDHCKAYADNGGVVHLSQLEAQLCEDKIGRYLHIAKLHLECAKVVHDAANNWKSDQAKKCLETLAKDFGQPRGLVFDLAAELSADGKARPSAEPKLTMFLALFFERRRQFDSEARLVPLELEYMPEGTGEVYPSPRFAFIDLSVPDTQSSSVGGGERCAAKTFGEALDDAKRSVVQRSDCDIRWSLLFGGKLDPTELLGPSAGATFAVGFRQLLNAHDRSALHLLSRFMNPLALLSGVAISAAMRKTENQKGLLCDVGRLFEKLLAVVRTHGTVAHIHTFVVAENQDCDNLGLTKDRGNPLVYRDHEYDFQVRKVGTLNELIRVLFWVWLTRRIKERRVLLGVLSVLITSFFLLGMAALSARGAAEASNHANAVGTAHRFDDEFNNLSTAVDSVARSANTILALQTTNNKTTLEGILAQADKKQRQSNSNSIVNLSNWMFVGPDGRFLAYYPLGREFHINVREREYFQRAITNTGSPCITHAIYSATDGDYKLHVSQAVRVDPKGPPLGILVAAVGPEYAEDLFGGLMQSTGTRYAVIAECNTNRLSSETKPVRVPDFVTLMLSEYPFFTNLYFTTNDLYDLESFASVLQDPGDPVSKFLFTNLDPLCTNALANHMAEFPLLLATNLNRLIGGVIYNSNLFASVSLRRKTQALLAQRIQKNNDLVYLNRCLITDWHPEYLRGRVALPVSRAEALSLLGNSVRLANDGVSDKPYYEPSELGSSRLHFVSGFARVPSAPLYIVCATPDPLLDAVPRFEVLATVIGVFIIAPSIVEQARRLLRRRRCKQRLEAARN